ncbi:MAG: hypothetical protein WC686_05715 [Candidatus Shapirobacteria bacterium]|jgi:hypothetical protein
MGFLKTASIAFLVWLFNFVLLSPARAAVTYDLSSPSTWNLRIEGQFPGDHTPDNVLETADFDGDGVADYLIGSIGSDYYHNHTGSLFFVNGSLLGSWGIGKSYDLQPAANYTIRIDDNTEESYYPTSPQVFDINNDGLPDFLVVNPEFTGATGGAYAFLNDKLRSFTGVGNTAILGSPATYSFRFADHYVTAAANGDFDGDGLDDLAIGVYDSHEITQGGAVYILFNHKINSLTGGTTVPLETGNNFDVRIDGDIRNMYLGSMVANLGDINKDGKDELGVSSYGFENGNGNFSGSLYIFSGDYLSGYKSTGSSILVGTASSYNVRIDGPSGGAYFSVNDNMAYGDIDGDGGSDILAASGDAEGGKGAAFLYCNNYLSDKISSFGNILETASSVSYSSKFIGAAANDTLGDYALSSADINNDGKDDIVVGGSRYGADQNGKLYLIYGSANLCGSTGVNIDLANTSNYQVKYQGAAGSSLGMLPGVSLVDTNNDGSIDLLAGAIETNYLRFAAGSAYTILNFPHTLSLGASSFYQQSDSVTLTGSVGATDSVTTISNVQYSIGSSNPAGTWESCTSSDSTFDSRSESFSCTITGLVEGVNSVFVRAVDSNGSYTPRSHYASALATVDLTAADFSGVGSSSSSTGSTISFTTSEATSVYANFGLTALYGSSTAEVDTSPQATAHSLNLTSLLPCRVYHYQLRSSDQAANQKISSDYTLATTGCTVGASIVGYTDVTIDLDSSGFLNLLSTGGRGLGLTIPASSTGLTDPVQFAAFQLDSAQTFLQIAAPSDYHPIGVFTYELKSINTAATTPVTTFAQPQTLSITYDQGDLGNDIDESTLTLFRYDGSSWNQLSDCQLNTTLRRISCATSQFSLFVLMGKNKSTTSNPPPPSGPSSPACNDPAPAQTPHLFEINTTSTTAKLFFTPISNTSDFFISFSATNLQAEEHGEQITLLREGIQSHTLFNLKPNTLYYFKIRGQLGCTPGQWSNILKAKTTSSKNKLAKYYPNSKIAVFSPLRPVPVKTFLPKPTASVLGITSPPELIATYSPPPEPSDFVATPAPRAVKVTPVPPSTLWGKIKQALGF